MSHPPHLGSSWGSALIPFCAYKADLNFSRNSFTLPGISFPLCSAFIPTILEGQLCYKLTLKDWSAQGKRNSLVLVIDANINRQLSFFTFSQQGDPSFLSSKTHLDFDELYSETASAKIHINTLSAFNGFGAGIYTMTDVMRMTLKEDFLEMPSKHNKCNIEFYEDCRTRRLLQECSCVPWDLPDFQVKLR